MLADHEGLRNLKAELNREKKRKIVAVIGCLKHGRLCTQTSRGERVELSEDWTNFFFKGDKLEVALSPPISLSRCVGEPEKLLGSALLPTKEYIGQLVRRQQKWYLTPSSSPWITLAALAAKNHVPLSAKDGFKEGDWVWFRVERCPFLTSDKKPSSAGKAIITGLIASSNHPFCMWRVAQAQQGLPLDPPSSALASDFPVVDGCDDRRVDLTHLPFFTIDNLGTKEIDDALCIEPLSEGSVRLWIAIADPTAYLAPGSPIAQEAFQRAMSQYLVGLSVPMLPKRLVEGHCSLLSEQKRPALVMSIEFFENGQVSSEAIQFQLAFIQCRAQLDYRSVSHELEGISTLDACLPVGVRHGLPFLKLFVDAKWPVSLEASAPWLGNSEYRFFINGSGKVTDIQLEPRCVAKKAIEKIMILSNFFFAQWAQNLPRVEQSALFSVNIGFDKKQLNLIKPILSDHAPELLEYDLETLAGFNRVKAFAFEPGNETLQLKLAAYQAATHFSLTPGEHFAIGLPCYATWTSPLRRYQDLANHWFIKSQLGALPSVVPLDQKACKHLILQKRMIRLAVAKIKQQLYFQYLTKTFKKGAIYLARVTGLTSSACYVTLEKNGATVFLFVDEKQKATLVLGQKLTVCLWRFSTEQKMVWVRLAAVEQPGVISVERKMKKRQDEQMQCARKVQATCAALSEDVDVSVVSSK